MADYFDSAQTNADQSKAALLAAISQYGSQAAQALKAGQDQLASAKQSAISAELAGAQKMNAPAALQSQLSAQIGQPYDQRIGSLGQEAASRQAGFDSQTAGANNYMTEANAALPAIRGQLAQKVATLQAQAQAQLEKDRQDQAMQAATFSQNQQLKDLELQIAQANLAKSQAAGTGANAGVGKILSDQFGGLSGFNDLVTSQAPGLRADQNAAYRDQQSSLRSLGAKGNLAARADSRESDPGLTPVDVADALGQSAGLPAGQGGALYQSYLDKQAASDAKSAGSADSIRQSPDYQSAASELLKGVKAGTPVAGIAQGLTDQFGPDIARQILSDYAAVLPAKPPYGG